MEYTMVSERMEKINATAKEKIDSNSVYEWKMKEEEIERIREIAEEKIKKINGKYSLRIEYKGVSCSNCIKLVDHIYETLCLPRDDKSRKPEYIIPRYAVMYYLVKFKRLLLKETGSIFGGLDHSTVLHANNVFKGMLQVNDCAARSLLDCVLASANSFVENSEEINQTN